MARIALIMSAASVVLLVAFASSANAEDSTATISPTSANFGRVLIGKKSAPITFTVTKGPEPGGFAIISQGGNFVVSYYHGGFEQTAATPAPACITYEGIDDQFPSCTITVRFQPTVPGRSKGAVSPNNLRPDPFAQLTGIGLIPWRDCHPKSRNKWCQKKPTKKKPAERDFR
jgi:hypothetical protein